MRVLRFAIAAMLVPGISAACPYCMTAGGGREGYVVGTLLLLLLPAGLVGALVLWLRRATRATRSELS